jgi:hypothetical protein
MFSTIMWKNKKHFKFESVENSKSFFGSWSDFLHKKMILENIQFIQNQNYLSTFGSTAPLNPLIANS